MKKVAVDEMAQQFSTTDEEIHRKLHNLRNQFNGELKKMSEKKSGKVYASKWPYLKPLLFLKRSVMSRPKRGNTANDFDGEDYDTPESTDAMASNHCFVQLDEKEPSAPAKKQKTELLVPNDVFLQKAMRTLVKDEDEFDIFGKYIASEMRSLSPHLRRKMKRKIHEVLIQINEEEDLIVISDASSVSKYLSQ